MSNKERKVSPCQCPDDLDGGHMLGHVTPYLPLCLSAGETVYDCLKIDVRIGPKDELHDLGMKMPAAYFINT